jgi:photosystem II stability/assembly factor-like uncharacterized protein
MMDGPLKHARTAPWRQVWAITCGVSLLALGTLSPLDALASTPWFPFGPDGGDARAFAADPHNHEHLFLGAANGWIYDSQNGGHTWKRLARVGNRDDLVLDNIVVDPADSNHILAGTWVLGSDDGGLFVSTNGGHTWTSNPEMEHQSIRALTAAPSNGRIVVAGTLKGVYRSDDSGTHWKLISPPGSTEIHEVESIAIDPTNPEIIYAGTWHLPWKTTDGGANWSNIKQGIIEDSDVFSIIVDPKQPNIVYASACSGIYKSEDGAAKFTKIQGIPMSARRTRVLMQDPQHLGTVYAGTTEGLFRTDDAGALWTRTTSDDVIVNDVYVDPTNSMHVLMATDRGGVLASNDGGVSFVESNTGFSSRQIVAFASDPRRPAEVYVGVVNDKQWGGVFFSNDGGLAWSMRSSGLDGRDVFSLAVADEGTVVAGTEHGLFLYDPKDQLWLRTGDILPHSERSGRTGGQSGSAAVRRTVRANTPHERIDGAVLTLARVDGQLYAVTTDGVFATVSGDPALPWARLEGPTEEPWRFLAGGQSTLLLASLKSLTLSIDGGRRWRMIPAPPALTQIGAVAVDGTGGLWVGGREGIYHSVDNGATWATSKSLYVNGVNNIFYDAAGSRLLITASGSSTFAFSLHLPDQTMKYWDTGWNLRFMRPVGDYLLGITRYDGVVVQPRMVQSTENPRANPGAPSKEFASQ